MSDARATILIIEDEPEIRRFLRSSLTTEGYKVVEAETAGRGEIDAATHKPDLAIVDLGLPDFDGVELIRRIRKWSSMPILVLSARVQESAKIAALMRKGKKVTTGVKLLGKTWRQMICALDKPNARAARTKSNWRFLKNSART